MVSRERRESYVVDELQLQRFEAENIVSHYGLEYRKSDNDLDRVSVLLRQSDVGESYAMADF